MGHEDKECERDRSQYGSIWKRQPIVTWRMTDNQNHLLILVCKTM